MHCKSKSKVGPLVNSSNIIQVEDEKQMCEILNKYLSAVFTSEGLEGLTVIENRLKLNN